MDLKDYKGSDFGMWLFLLYNRVEHEWSSIRKCVGFLLGQKGPYQWGDCKVGFHCSSISKLVYQLEGLNDNIFTYSCILDLLHVALTFTYFLP